MTCNQILYEFCKIIIFNPGRYNAHDIVNFAKESASSNVRVLNPEDFPRILEKKENWFVDFFAPVSSQLLLTIYDDD